MFYYEGLSCPVCNKAFVQDDDIVVCPQCGLPHHRRCWTTLNQCFAADAHGTEHQWCRETAKSTQSTASTPNNQTQTCGHCQTVNAEYAEFCNKCGSPLPGKAWQSSSQPTHHPYREYTPYPHNNFYEETYSADELIDGVSTKDLAAVVGKNAKYYIKRFRDIRQGKSGGWNWAAFILSPYWLFYRKQYLLGILYLTVFLLSNIAFAILYAPVQLATTTEAAETAMLAMMDQPLFLPVMGLSCVFLLLKIIIGLRGNAFYLRHCCEKINKSKITTPDLSAAEMSSLGGVSAGVAVLIYVVTSILIEVVTILSI